MVTTPFWVESQLQQNPAWYGYLVADLSLGLMLGGLLAGRQFQFTQGLMGRAGLLMIAATIAPVLLVGLGFIHNLYLALGLFFIVGACNGVANVTLITQLQVLVPNVIRGRVASVFMIICTTAYPVSGFIGGMLIDGLDNDMVQVQGLSGLVGALLLYPLLFSKRLWQVMEMSTLLVKGY